MEVCPARAAARQPHRKSSSDTWRRNRASRTCPTARSLSSGWQREQLAHRSSRTLAGLCPASRGYIPPLQRREGGPLSGSGPGFYPGCDRALPDDDRPEMGVTSGIDLTASQRQAVLRLIQACLPHTEVCAYGSRVKRTSGSSSDLDLVASAGDGQRRHVANLREAFDESDLPFRVDVLVWDDVPESFREEILRERVVLTSSRKAPPASGRSTR